jgi:hypothetical protein
MLGEFQFHEGIEVYGGTSLSFCGRARQKAAGEEIEPAP